MAPRQPIIFVVGPTASGKTAVAIELARKINGEVICADSRTVYQGMNVGTAKPTLKEMKDIPHWGLDIVNPAVRYTAAQFQNYALEKMMQIQQRGHTPIIVGGTGLYIDSLLFEYNFPTPPSDEERAQFEAMSLDELYAYCIKNNVELPFNDKNKRHLIHAIASKEGVLRDNTQPARQHIVVGIATEKVELEQRIAVRIEHMFADGVVNEAIMLGKKYGWNAEAMTSNVYRSIKSYIDGLEPLDKVAENLKIRDWQLAKRQMTWFRRNPHIMWVSRQDAVNYALTRLNNV